MDQSEISAHSSLCILTVYFVYLLSAQSMNLKIERLASPWQPSLAIKQRPQALIAFFSAQNELSMTIHFELQPPCYVARLDFEFKSIGIVKCII